MPHANLSEEEIIALREVLSGGATVHAVEGFTTTDYYEAAANTLPGAANFTAQVGIRIWGQLSTQETAFSCIDINTPADGGWYLGFSSTRFLAGAVQDSDGTLIANNTANMVDYRGHIQGLLHVITLTVSGTTMKVYVNGQDIFTGTLTGGFRVADPTLVPMIGRNNNVFNETEALTTGFVFGGYMESALTAQEVLEQYLDSVEGDTIVDPGWSNSWLASSDPSSMDDQIGNVDFTENGNLRSIEYKLRF